MSSNQPLIFSEEEGAIDMPAFRLPLSVYMSPEAKRAFINKRAAVSIFDASSNETLRTTTNKHYWGPLLERARHRYSVNPNKRPSPESRSTLSRRSLSWRNTIIVF